MTENSSFDPTRLELVDVTSPAANRGAIRLRPVDPFTLEPIVNIWGDTSPSTESYEYVEVAPGRFGFGPATAGSHSVTVNAPGHDPVTVPATVVAGQWTDLGDVVMTRSGAMPAPVQVCVNPPLRPGATQNVVVRGRGFYAGAGLDLVPASSWIQINSFVYRDWSAIEANVTVSASAPPGMLSRAVKVTLPDGQTAFGQAMVLPVPVPVTRPPNRVPRVYAVKSLPSDVSLVWDDSPVDASHAAVASYPVFRSVTIVDSGYTQIADVTNSAASQETPSDAGALGSAAPFSVLHFYRVIGLNSDGDSGDRPRP